jgi:pimeloyl-ACP methyl ester carboxylesterase
MMEAQGFSRFSVAGHDRGARVAYRMALDHPARVERLAVLDIIPTGEALSRAGANPCPQRSDGASKVPIKAVGDAG